MLAIEKQVEREPLLEAVVALWSALEYRENCPECGGKGYDYVQCGDEDVSAETCECSNDALVILDKFQEVFLTASQEYIKQQRIDQAEIDKLYEKLSYGLLEYVISPVSSQLAIRRLP